MKSKYSVLGLKFNPFPKPGSDEAIETVAHVLTPEEIQKRVEETAKRFNPNARREELEWLDRNIKEPFLRGESCSNTWVIGPKGVGKSALLLYFKKMFTIPGVDVVYVKLPVRGVSDIYHIFIRALGIGFFQKMSSITYAKYFNTHNEDFILELCSRMRPKTDIPKLENLRKVVSSLRDKGENVPQVLQEGIISRRAWNKIKGSIVNWLFSRFAIHLKLATVLAYIFDDPDRYFSGPYRYFSGPGR